MEHIDFHISYRCFNKCVFCSSADSIAKYINHPLKIQDILRILKSYYKKGFRSVNFTGGEPTLFYDFSGLVKEAKALGFKIYVGTNGGGFATKRFCRAAAPFIDEVCFSYHGHTSRLHNLLTSNKESFGRLERARTNLSEFPVRFLNNTVITKYNIEHLANILNFLKNRGISQVLFSNLAPEGRGLRNYDRLVVRLASLKEKIPALIQIANRKNIVIRFFGLPACILGDFACYSNDFCWDARLNIEQDKNRKFYLKEETCFLPTRNRLKTAKCKGCIYLEICGGVFSEYLKKFGDEELKSLHK